MNRQKSIGLPTATRLLAVVLALSLAACATTRQTEAAQGSFTLRLIGSRTLAHALQFGGTTVGGLSGIDYDPAADLYYLISDDRGHYAPNRFYTARLALDATRFADVALQTVVLLKRADGSAYPPGTADSEAIRYDPTSHDLWWTSEGARKLSGRRERSVLIDPFVRRATVAGDYVGEVPLDPMFRISADARGPRDNLVFEGLTLSPDGRSLWVSMEAPLLQDGPMPTMSTGAWARISRHDRDPSDPQAGFGPLRAQYAYRVDAIPSAGAWTSAYALNGISEILATGPTTMLVLERALVIGAGWRIRVFEADWRDATDVKAIASLSAMPQPFLPMSKRLVFDFDSLGITIDNLEGLCFGPTLANGHRTLVFVSDDNFNAGQATQFLAFEIVPR
ncbi:MAG: esterase-like activity of phytase family protein [Burkholderiaceae bacterium]